jgi:hypothetical protein
MKVLDLLLKAGASLLAKDRRGVTLGEMARQLTVGRASKEVLEWFVQRDTV